MNNISEDSTLSQIFEKARLKVASFTELKKKNLKESLEHGLALLKTDDEMDMYLALYGDIASSKVDYGLFEIAI